MVGFSSVATLLSFASISYAQTYTQKVKWQGANFFDAFNFFTDPDPTHGFVKYVDRATAQKNGLISTTANSAYMGVDYTSNLPADGSKGGRQSVRLTSKMSFTQGLFIADITHMPASTCGVWPAWWTFGPDWPNNGEIDIIEGVSKQSKNIMSLHTGPNCTVTGAGQSGTLNAANCWQYAPNQYNTGCTSTDSRSWTFGDVFNRYGGGVFAMEWAATHIRIWYWQRSVVPKDVQNGSPNPSGWGTPAANFEGGCDINSHFKNHNMIFDTTFCGDWAGSVWGSDGSCSGLAPTCNAYVAQNAAAFKNAYWLINSVAVYQAATPVSSAVKAASSVAPAPKALLANIAAGASGPAAPGVTPASSTAVASTLQQVVATANATQGTDLQRRAPDVVDLEQLLTA